MEVHDRLSRRVSEEQDDLLTTAWLVDGDEELSRHVFDRLVDLLLEGLLVELREEYLEGRLTRAEYARRLVELAAQCERAGLAIPV